MDRTPWSLLGGAGSKSTVIARTGQPPPLFPREALDQCRGARRVDSEGDSRRRVRRKVGTLGGGATTKRPEIARPPRQHRAFHRHSWGCGRCGVCCVAWLANSPAIRCTARLASIRICRNARPRDLFRASLGDGVVGIVALLLALEDQEIVVAAAWAVGIAAAYAGARVIHRAAALFLVEEGTRGVEDPVLSMAQHRRLLLRVVAGVAFFRLLVVHAEVACQSRDVARRHLDVGIGAAVGGAFLARILDAHRDGEGFFHGPANCTGVRGSTALPCPRLRRAPQSTVIPARRITFSKRGTCAPRNAANSSGEFSTGRSPCSRSFSCTAGGSRAR